MTVKFATYHHLVFLSIGEYIIILVTSKFIFLSRDEDNKTQYARSIAW